MTNPLVSLCIPVYNVVSFIERCARSLFEQTYANVEYIFVDDCSPDDSIAILEKVMLDYANVTGKMHIVRHEYNRGLAAARNTAVAAAKGIFLIHVDSDDWIEPNMVEDLVRTQRMTGADIVSCNAVAHYLDGEVLLEEPDYSSKDEMMRSVIQMTLDHVIWRRLIRTSLYKDNNVFAEEGVNIGEDHYTLPRLLYYAKSFSKCDEALYHYNCLNNESYTRSDSSSFNLIRYCSNRDSINILVNFFMLYDKSYLDELYSIKTHYIYSQFFNVLKEGNVEAYNELSNDWKSVDDTYKLALGLTPRRVRLLAGKYAQNRTRVVFRIALKKFFGIRRYEL